MPMGQAWSRILTPYALKSLQEGYERLISDIEYDIDQLRKTGSLTENSNIVCYEYLPMRYFYRYTEGFLVKFLDCIKKVGWKLEQEKCLRLDSLAEELAASAIINATKLYAYRAGGNVWGRFEDLFFEDMDFLLLFDNRFDGIEETEFAEEMGYVNLAIADWFTPFRGKLDEEHENLW